MKNLLKIILFLLIPLFFITSFFIRFFSKLKLQSHISNTYWTDIKDETYERIFKSYKTKSKLGQKPTKSIKLEGDLNSDNYTFY